MTRDEMLKTSWKPYMELTWHHHRDGDFSCILSEINFDDETITVIMMDDRVVQKGQEYTLNLNHISIPKRPRLKVVK